MGENLPIILNSKLLLTSHFLNLHSFTFILDNNLFQVFVWVSLLSLNLCLFSYFAVLLIYLLLKLVCWTFLPLSCYLFS